MPGEDHSGAAAALFEPEESRDLEGMEDNNGQQATSDDEQVKLINEDPDGEEIDELDSDREVCGHLT